MQYRQVRVIAGRFRAALRGVAVDKGGHIYAAGDSEIKVFDAEGEWLERWPTTKAALSVAVAPDGSVYAGEPGQIEIFDTAGKLIDAWRDEKLLGFVTAIGFTNDSVLAGDVGGRAVRRFDRHGKLLNTIGKDNPVNGLLICNGVVSFAVDAQGVIHAANPGKHRVEQYASDGRLLGHIGRFDGVDPAGFTGCCNPTNVAVGDCLYTTEKAGPRVKAYDFSGKLLTIVAEDAFDANCKNMSIAVDSNGRLYVVDTVKLAIFMFEEVAA